MKSKTTSGKGKYRVADFILAQFFSSANTWFSFVFGAGDPFEPDKRPPFQEELFTSHACQSALYWNVSRVESIVRYDGISCGPKEKTRALNGIHGRLD